MDKINAEQASLITAAGRAKDKEFQDKYAEIAKRIRNQAHDGKSSLTIKVDDSSKRSLYVKIMDELEKNNFMIKPIKKGVLIGFMIKW